MFVPIVLFFYFFNTDAAKTYPILKPIRVGNCIEHPPEWYKNKSEYENVTILPYTRDTTLFSYVLTLRHPARFPKGLIKFSKCETRAISTCEEIMSFKIKACDKMKDEGQFYTKMIKKYDPPVQCPRESGVHRLVNATFEVGKLIALLNGYPGLDTLYWRLVYINFEHKSQTRINLCFEAVMKIFYIKEV